MADAKSANELGKSVGHRKASAIDMEAGGVGYAAKYAQVEFLVVKSISDYADKRKKDDYHEYAARASAEFVFEVCKRLSS